jgi:hypothetical protein
MTNKHTDAPGYSTFSGKEVSGGGGQSAGEAIATEQLRWRKEYLPKVSFRQAQHFGSENRLPAGGGYANVTISTPAGHVVGGGGGQTVVKTLQQLWLVDGVEEWRDVPEVEA